MYHHLKRQPSWRVKKDELSLKLPLTSEQITTLYGQQLNGRISLNSKSKWLAASFRFTLVLSYAAAYSLLVASTTILRDLTQIQIWTWSLSAAISRKFRDLPRCDQSRNQENLHTSLRIRYKTQFFQRSGLNTWRQTNRHGTERGAQRGSGQSTSWCCLCRSWTMAYRIYSHLSARGEQWKTQSSYISWFLKGIS